MKRRPALRCLLVLALPSLSRSATGGETPPSAPPPEVITRLGSQPFVHGGRVHDVFFLGDSRTLFSAAEDGLYFWNVSGGGGLLSHPAPEPPGRRIAKATATPDGRMIVLTTDREELGVMDPLKPAAIRWFKVEDASASALAVSADGKQAATGGGLHSAGGSRTATSSASQVMVWDLPTGQVVRRLAVSGSGVQALAFSPDGRRLASSGRRGSTTQLWNLADGRELRH